jgi:hypothetical protein
VLVDVSVSGSTSLVGVMANLRTIHVVTPWNSRARIAAVTAIALALVMMLLTFMFDNRLLVAVGVLTLALVGVATTRTLPAGSCPSCQARPRQQERTVLSCQVQRYDQGTLDSWTVHATVDRLCTNCRESRQLVEVVVIPKVDAATPAEAVVLASNGSFQPSRILTSQSN